MKSRKTVIFLVTLIIILSSISSIVGIFSNDGSGTYEFESIRNEKVEIYGKGLYKNDSKSMVAQGKAQDIVTLVIGIPLLIISLYLSLKKSLKGKLLLTGTLGYFLYTYMSYVFLWMYNPFFIIYVILMSISFFAFILLMVSFDLERLPSYFSKKLPIRFLGGFQIFFAIAISMLWIKRILTPIINETTIVGLEHYTTLVIQAMDLGFLVPAAFLSGVLLLRKKPLGYLLSSIIIMKGITMATAITAMIIGQAYMGIEVTLMEIVIFSTISLFIAYSLILLLKNIKDK
ncbi:hypothetical protein [Dethiothermospora halolimnae]|uniref:hypothetical protein n=1 Tax=Dethiothermospora halolimnae TaxID=3114390 RepID=UPI003CCB75F7